MLNGISMWGGQILLVTASEGIVQQEGEEPRKLHAGDVAVIRSGVKHWHGSTADAWLSAHHGVTREARNVASVRQ